MSVACCHSVFYIHNHKTRPSTIKIKNRTISDPLLKATTCPPPGWWSRAEVGGEKPPPRENHRRRGRGGHGKPPAPGGGKNKRKRGSNCENGSVHIFFRTDRCILKTRRFRMHRCTTAHRCILKTPGFRMHRWATNSSPIGAYSKHGVFVCADGPRKPKFALHF